MDLTTTGFMCEPHWKLVPPPIRSALQSAVTTTAQPSTGDLVLMRGAVDAVAHAESRQRGRTRPTGKPIQLTLF